MEHITSQAAFIIKDQSDITPQNTRTTTVEICVICIRITVAMEIPKQVSYVQQTRVNRINRKAQRVDSLQVTVHFQKVLPIVKPVNDVLKLVFDF